VLPDGFGFLRPGLQYLRARRHYVSPRRFAASTSAPATPFGSGAAAEDTERYFALLKVEAINFETPDRRATRSSSTT